MEQHRIRELLDLYFEGETTTLQEQELKHLFSTAESIPADLMPYKAMFAAFERSKEDVPKQGATVKSPRIAYRVALRAISSIAACLLLGVFIWLGAKSDKQDIVCYIDGVEITDSDRAMAEAQRLMGEVNEDIALAMTTIENLF